MPVERRVNTGLTFLIFAHMCCRTLRQVHYAHADASYEIRHAVVPDGVLGQPVEDRQPADDTSLEFGC